jgi:TPR repeat protein
MWLGAGYERGWFGKPNFHEALKWYRKAAAQGDPDGKTGCAKCIAKCMRMAKVSNKIT